MSEFSDRPLVAGSLIGTRSFRVDKLGRLTGVTHREVWKPGVNTAECRKGMGLTWNMGGLITPATLYHYLGGGTVVPDVKAKPEVEPGPDEAPHQVASLGCACGFYAYTDNEANPHHEDGNVLAVVEASGVATVGTRGFRAEKAEIVAFVAPGRPKVRNLWDRYSEWSDDHFALSGVIVVLSVLGAIFGTAFFMTAGLWALGIAAFALGASGAIATIGANLHGQQLDFHDSRQKRDHLSAEAFARVQRNYPDVPVFRSLSAALDRFPLSAPPEPTPDDEDFWTRGI